MGKLPPLLAQYPQYAQRIRENMLMQNDTALIAYTRFLSDEGQDAPLFCELGQYEIFDGKLPKEEYKALTLGRWKAFGEQQAQSNKNGCIVFECAFLQNHVNELLLFHQAQPQELTAFSIALLKQVKAMRPVLFYLDPVDEKESLCRVAKERVNSAGEEVWRERVAEYIAQSPLGQAKGYTGFDGMLEYFSYRKAIEKAMLPSLPIPTHIIPIRQFDWETAWQTIDAQLKNL